MAAGGCPPERGGIIMNQNDKIHGFTVTRIRPLPELEGRLVELVHDRTGLLALWIDRKEENKTFGIAFETLPWNDTGVFHILEHSVLGGSEKYRVKEPFVELIKTSMNTFINAMTYPDKTVYPVCSRNPKDFVNLVRVYLDAVFHPLIYTKPEIFYQEGWHYELDESGTPSYKGVVFNEMKGAMADPDELAVTAMNKALFPDSPYSYVSGGDPAKIPDLSYEEFLDSHRKFYSPSNAYVFLDGEMDIENILGIISEEYLSGFEKTKRVPPPEYQPPVKSEREEIEFEVSQSEDSSNKTRLAWGSVVGGFEDRLRLTAVRVLLSALAGSNQSPLCRAVLSSGLAEEVTLDLYDGVLQPWTVLLVKNLAYENADKVSKIVTDELTRLSKEGIDRSLLEASMAHLEFVMRERDYGYSPSGLVLGLGTLETWLYGGDPIDNLEVGDLFVRLKALVDEGYFERLIVELFLDNPHSCCVLMKPSLELGEKRRQAELARLDAESSMWTDGERQELLTRQRSLESWQKEENSKEDMDALPKLGIEDISTEPEAIPTRELLVNGVRVLEHDINCNGIVYYSLYFDAGSLGEEELKQLGLICELIGELGTRYHSEEEIINLKKLLLGRLSLGVSGLDPVDGGDTSVKLTVGFSALRENSKKALELVCELICDTLFDSESSVRDILRQAKLRLFQSAVMSGNGIAISRLSAQLSASGVVGECTSGFEFYKWLKAADESWSWEELKASLSSLMGRLITSCGMVLSVTGGDSETSSEAADILLSRLPKTEAAGTGVAVAPWGARSEGIIIPADICFACVGGDLTKNGVSYSGQLQLAARIVSYSYLWNEIRVQGGAYGTGMRVTQDGLAFIYSYRDPSASRSLECYSRISGFIKEFSASQEDLTGFIIGTANSPLLSPKLKGAVADSRYFRGITQELRRSLLKQIIESSRQDLLDMADGIQSTLDSGCVCVLAPKEKLLECRLENIQSL